MKNKFKLLSTSLIVALTCASSQPSYGMEDNNDKILKNYTTNIKFNLDIKFKSKHDEFFLEEYKTYWAITETNKTGEPLCKDNNLYETFREFKRKVLVNLSGVKKDGYISFYCQYYPKNFTSNSAAKGFYNQCTAKVADLIKKDKINISLSCEDVKQHNNPPTDKYKWVVNEKELGGKVMF